VSTLVITNLILSDLERTAAGPSLLNDITCRLNNQEMDDDTETPQPDAFMTHIYPTDCSNITLTMKTLISGFVKIFPNGENGVGYPFPSSVT
jgi:hypothetical protein